MRRIALQPHPASRPRPAFTIVDAMMTVAVLAMLAVLVLPTMGDEQRSRVSAAARILTSDLEYARALSIASPRDPVVFRIDPADNKYWIARVADPDVPINRPDTNEPYEVTLGLGRARAAAGIRIAPVASSDESIEFDAFGGIAGIGASPTLQLFVESTTRHLDIVVSRATGAIAHEDHLQVD